MKSLFELYREHQGKVSDKWSIYLSEYDRIFSAYREQPVSILEIGIQNGGSLEVWSKYFPNAQAIVGCDINHDCAKLVYVDSRIKVVVGDANTGASETEVLSHSSCFDLIIDDGSHTSSDIVKSFARYFRHLNYGGVFVAEDLHCSYWENYEGGLYYPYSSISFFKRLADVINYEHWGVEKERRQLLQGFSQQLSTEFDESDLAEVHSIEFFNSVCVVHKRKAQSNVLGERYIAGQSELIVDGHQGLAGYISTPQSQFDNPWAKIKSAPEEHWEELTQLLSERDGQIASLIQAVNKRQIQITGLNQAVTERDGQIASLNQAVNERQGQITGLNQTVTERDGQITGLNQAVAERDGQITDLNQAVAERDGQITGLNQAVAERDGQITNLSQAVHDKEVHIGNLNSTIAQRDALIDALYGSSSWRISMPLRFVAHQAKRVKRVVELIQPAITRGGGLKNTLRKAIRLYQREGIAGIRRGFKFVAMASEVIPAVGSAVFDRNDYAEWVRRYDTLTEEARATMRSRINGFKNKPLISVLMPTYNTKAKWLIEAIESVRNQIYPHWEMCIADDASTDKTVRALLERYAKEDKRIKVVYREKNGHISAASNGALALVSGQWVALLDHDDLLTEHALFWVVDAINQNPTAGLIYSDEDKLDSNGQRFDPYFKSDFNPELMLAQNMVCHLGVYRFDLLKTLNGFRTGFEGAQDYDLALRVTEQILPKEIIHIPRVLYHWRAIPGSTALAAEEKNYAADAGRLAVAAHLKRRGLAAEVTAAPEALALNRVRFALPASLPLVSVIIPTRDHVDLLSTCIQSILELTTYTAFEIIIIDNGSVEPATAEFFASLPADRVKVIRDNSPFNFSALNNHGAQLARGELLCLMNNDIEILTPDWLEEMVSFAGQPEVGCVGARLWYPDGRLQHGGVVVGLGGVAGHSHKYAPKGFPGYFRRAVLHQSLSAVTAACLLVRRSVFESVNGLDEKLAVAFNDVDFCLRIQEAGYRNVWTPYAEMIHHESVSRGHENTPEKQARFASEVQKMKERWGNDLLVDPAYSPNLTLDYEDFSLAWPPRVGNGL